MVLLRELSGRGDFNRKSAANSGFFQAWQSILVEMNRMGDVQPAILEKKKRILTRRSKDPRVWLPEQCQWQRSETHSR
ncbi:MAG: hypothetical protein CMJ81_15280 [Planctomycetaceae bacterium]|jgi:hypothetical protein|nr:hypothetical protein [Planctomycetaceae bacterium]